NYVFNPNGQLEIEVKKQETGDFLNAPMLLKNNRFEFETSSLSPGAYNFSIKEVNSGILENGNFVILEFNIEQQFSSANLKGMQDLAANNGSQLYFFNSSGDLITELLRDNTYV